MHIFIRDRNEKIELLCFLVNSTNVLVPYTTKFLHTTIASIKLLFSCFLALKIEQIEKAVPTLTIYFPPKMQLPPLKN